MKMFKKNDTYVKYIKLTYFIMEPWYANNIAEILPHGTKSLFVTMGNSTGVSHYGIYWGMQKQMSFIQYACGVLGILLT